jgi:Tryptophan-associated transmembrane protein (Trp_oprn_chp)
METRASRSLDAGAIVGLAGGALLIIGSVLTWASVSINIDNLARALGVDPSLIPPGAVPGKQSFAGTGSRDGKIALACGVLALVAAVLVIMMRGRTVASVVLMIGGLVGGGFALYDGLTGKDRAIDEAGRALSGQGIPGDVSAFFNVTIGIGIWICVVGGGLAILAGLMVITKKAAPAAMAAQPGSPVGMGTGVPAVAPDPMGGTSPTPPSMPPMPPTPPMDTPGAGGAPPTA